MQLAILHGEGYKKNHAFSSDDRVLSFDLALEDIIIKPKMDEGVYLFVRINNRRKYITIRGAKP